MDSLATILLVDPRKGSGHYAELIRGAEVAKLDFADVVVIGPEHGPRKAPISVGIEIKKVSDFLACFEDNRFSGHQLGGLIGSYDIRYLLIEGRWRKGRGGEVERFVVRKGKRLWIPERALWAGVQNWITTHRLLAGIHIVLTKDEYETAAWIETVRAWVAKGWDKHTSHLAIYAKVQTVLGPDRRISTRGPSVEEAMIAQMPGVSLTKGRAIAKAFGTIGRMIEARETDWTRVAGIGKKLAVKFVRGLRTGKWQ